MIACGRRYCEVDDVELASVSLLISEVTCKACMKSRLFKTSVGIAKPRINNIPRMRTSVYRARGAFDEKWNYKLRSRFGLPENSITADERAELLAMEDQIHAGYAARKAVKGLT